MSLTVTLLAFRVESPEVKGRCKDRGNMTRLCTERCAEDGLTCTMEVEIDACTCGGRRIDVNEIAKFDMET